MPRHRRSAWLPPSDDSRLPFAVRCSDGHGRKGAVLLYRGILVTVPDAPPAVEWVAPGTTQAPPLGEPKDDGGRKVTLRCNVCGLDRQIRESLLVTAMTRRPAPTAARSR